MMIQHPTNYQYKKLRKEDKMTEELNELREQLIEKIITAILSMNNEELVGVSKLFGSTTQAGILSSEDISIPDEDDASEEESMLGWINQLINKGGTAVDVLEFLTTGTEDIKSRLVSILSVLGYQLKSGVEYTEEILHKVTIQALIKQGASEDIDLESMTEERTPIAAVKSIAVAPATTQGFDYKKVKVNKPVEDGTPVDQQINELIIKVGGDNLTEADLIMITDWNENYTPGQIFQALKRTFENSVFSLKSTNARLKIDFPKEEVGQDTSDKPRRVGKFGMGE